MWKQRKHTIILQVVASLRGCRYQQQQQQPRKITRLPRLRRLLSPPPFNPAIVNFDVLSDPDYQVVLRQAIDAQTSAFSPVMNVEPFSSLQVSDADHVLYHERFTSNVTTTMGGGIGYQLPHSLYAQPVFDSRANKDTVVGVLWGALAWDAYLANLLPQGVLGLIVVLHSSCAQDKSFTYELNGVEPTYLGARDLHDST